MSYRALPTQGLAGFEAAAPDASGPESVSARSHRDLWTSLLLRLVCLVVYNANLRSIRAGDTWVPSEAMTGLGGCLEKTILSSKPNQPPISRPEFTPEAS